MTAERAVEAIRARWAAGERQIVVSPECFDAYRSSLIVNTRYVADADSPRNAAAFPPLCYKDAKVHRAEV